MIDPVLGTVTYTEERGWLGSFTFPFLGRDVTVPLVLGGWDEADPIEPLQKDAVQQFNARKHELGALADDALYAHYRERLPELREQFGESADQLMPIVDNKVSLAGMITPTTFFVPLPGRDSVDRELGPLYDCTWAPELGLAVKFVNEAVVEVGPQNIIL